MDEEIGLLGATALDASPLQAKCLINLDSEEEGYLWAGCAGGMTAVSELPVRYQEETNEKWKVTVSGLAGGHSGAEIDKNRANATLLLARFLKEQRAGRVCYFRIKGRLKGQCHSKDCKCFDSGRKREDMQRMQRFSQKLLKKNIQAVMRESALL